MAGRLKQAVAEQQSQDGMSAGIQHYLISTTLVPSLSWSTPSKGLTSRISWVRGFMGGTPVRRAAW